MSKKKDNNKDVMMEKFRREGNGLLRRARNLLLLARSIVNEVEWLEGMINDLVNGKKGVDNYDKVERYYNRIGELEKVMMGVRDMLSELKDEYNILRTKVNTYSNKEVMKEYEDIIIDNEEGVPGVNGDEDDDSSSILGRDEDWWKGM